MQHRPLLDGFDDGVPEPLWTSIADPGTSLIEPGGAMIATLSSGVIGWVGYESARTYSLEDSRVFIEIPVMVNTATAAEANLSLSDPPRGIGITQERNELFFQYTLDGMSWVTVSRMPYDSASQRFWQIRESSGMVWMETSMDGVSWRIDGWTATPFDLSVVRVGILAGTYQDETDPREAHFSFVGGDLTPTCL